MWARLRTYPNKIFRRVFGLFWLLFDFKFGGQYTLSILPPKFKSKIGSKEPKNRLKLFIRIGSIALSILFSPLYAEEWVIDLRNPTYKHGILYTHEGGVIQNQDIR